MIEYDIVEPIYVIGEGEICKYQLKDAENYLEAYDIDCYKAFDADYRPLKLFKKDKYNRIGFRLEKLEPDKEKFFKEVKQYLSTYKIDQNIESFIDTIREYPYC